MTVELSMLGKDTQYPTQYQPDVLFPIAREPSRSAYAEVKGIRQGQDWWHVFEISWLDSNGIPQVAIGRLSLRADSPMLIESKSLKLYFNSLNFTKFASSKDFINTVEKDLSTAAQSPVALQLFHVDELGINHPQGICLDSLTVEQYSAEPDASLLKLDLNSTFNQDTQSETQDSSNNEFQFYSHLLRSNCPVTGQPDWGTIFIRYQGQTPCLKSLLSYIISFRQHNGFHEQCVEQIFADIWTQLSPEKLMVYAAYTRRGGLDINPCRVSDPAWLPTPIRLARQ